MRLAFFAGKISIAVFLLVVAIATVTVVMADTNSPEWPGSVTLITNVLPIREVASALAIEYDNVIDGAKLSPAGFEVEADLAGSIVKRTITKVYTNDKPAIAAAGKAGPYVIIEMDPNEATAGTNTYDPKAALTTRLVLKYYFMQKADITAVNGVKYPASPAKIKNNREVTPLLDEFKKMSVPDDAGNNLNYRFFEPVTQKNAKYPLVVFLHGIGERGYDNVIQLIGCRGGLTWATPETQSMNPCFVAAPQCPPTSIWTDEKNVNLNLILKMIAELQAKYAIDPNRIYITGVSMGGLATWMLIENNPKLFAAAMPVCGAGDPSKAALIKDLPIWAFHAEDDPVVPVAGTMSLGSATAVGSRLMAQALKDAGSTVVKYTEYPKGHVAPPLAPHPHFSWVPTYENREAINWMFAQITK